MVGRARRRKSSSGANRGGRGGLANEASRRATSGKTGTAQPTGSTLLYPMRSCLRRYAKVGGWMPNPMTAFVLLVSVRVFGALVNGIADCDETYNYWEPLHMLLHGSGLQTWEYSPEFAIRSYAFLFPYAVAARLGSWAKRMFLIFSPVQERLMQFYAVRISQSFVCALAELSLYDSSAFRFGPSVSRLLLVFLASSPGLFRASSELLPSSFAMIMFMFATSNWLIGRFRVAIVFVALAAELGWPFAALLGIPLALHVIYRRGLGLLLTVATFFGSLLLVAMVSIDSFYFGKLVFAPFNIILYNVFPGEGAGPDLYGTEPLSFYLTNLFLNCNLSFVAVVGYPLLMLFDFLGFSVHGNQQTAGRARMTRVIFLSPAYLWFAVFFIQPHKEERFLAPVYPLVALVGAVSIHDWCTLLCGPPSSLKLGPQDHSQRGSSCSRCGTWRGYVRGLIFIACVTVAIALGASRVLMQIKSFNAPFAAFSSFTRDELQNGVGPRNAPPTFADEGQNVNICIGREWYRFPNHFFMPSRRFRVRFVQSGFRGLLPKPFYEDGIGTRSIPPGMNMYNKEDPNQYLVDPHINCHYFVDLDLRDRDGSDAPEHIGAQLSEFSLLKERRLTLFSEKLLDLEQSPAGYRSFWVPGQTTGRLKYGMFEIYRNIDTLPIVL